MAQLNEALEKLAQTRQKVMQNRKGSTRWMVTDPDGGKRELKNDEMIEELDRLLASRKEYLLGEWIANAIRWAENEEERKLYQWNARNIITLWGTECTEGQFDDLNGYAQKQWSGLFKARARS